MLPIVIWVARDRPGARPRPLGCQPGAASPTCQEWRKEDPAEEEAAGVPLA